MGQETSRSWASFGSELIDIHTALHVNRDDTTAQHRHYVVESFLQEYLLHNIKQRLQEEPDLQSVTFSLLESGSWIHDTKVRDCNEFDFCLCMDSSDCQLGLKDSVISDVFSVMIKQQVTNPHLLQSPQGTEAGLLYMEFPMAKVINAIEDIVRCFWEVAEVWTRSQGCIRPGSFRVALVDKNGFALLLKLYWMDNAQTYHAVSVDLAPIYRNPSKKFSNIWTPPMHFYDQNSPYHQLKPRLQNTPLVLGYNTKSAGWKFNYYYTDMIFYGILNQYVPNSLNTLRLLKMLRDAKLPWKCQFDPETKELYDVVPWISSIHLQNVFQHEILENFTADSWENHHIPDRLLSILRRLLMLTSYPRKEWVHASSYLHTSQAEKTAGNKLHPVSLNIKCLLNVLYERKLQYAKGSVIAGEPCECSCHSQAQYLGYPPVHDVHDKTNECVLKWNPRCISDFRQPQVNRACVSHLCGHKTRNIATIRLNQLGLLNLLQSSQSLISEENLQRYLPSRHLRVMAVTWNTYETERVPHHLGAFLLHPQAHDMYVVSLQECETDRSDWEREVYKRLGQSFEILYSGSEGAIYTLIVIRKDLLQFCSEPEDDNVIIRRPLSNWLVRTKGALGVHFKLFGTSFLFINSHLTPKGGNVTKRIEDYHEICDDLELPKNYENTKYTTSHLTTRFDCVFWMGDLNFRMEGGKSAWTDPHRPPNCEELMHRYDELKKAMRKGEAFSPFSEGFISFPPSFRYLKGTDIFDQKEFTEQPSYADRILFLALEPSRVACVHYNNVMGITDSDHKPIHGSYQVLIKV